MGRDTELERLRQALEQARGGQLIAVVGEPGVGKSRLLYEFTHSHQLQGWLALESGSVSYGKAPPYLPVVDLLKTYFHLELRDDTRRVREKVTGKLLTLDRYARSLTAAPRRSRIARSWRLPRRPTLAFAPSRRRVPSVGLAFAQGPDLDRLGRAGEGTEGAAFVRPMRWQFFPFVAVTYLARLQTIPPELYGAARVDGASAWRRLVHVTPRPGPCCS